MSGGTGKLPTGTGSLGTGPLKKPAPPKQEGFWGHALDAVHEAGDLAGNAVGLVGEAAHKTISIAGDVVGGGIHLGGEAVAYGLDKAGAHASAHAIEAASKALGHGTSEFADGMGEAIGGMGTGLKETIEHPVHTVKNLAKLATHPKMLAETAKGVWAEARKGGWAHAAGYVVGSVAPALLSGGLGVAGDGAEAAGVVGDAAEGANAVSKVAELSEAAEGAGAASEVATLGKGASLVAKVGATMAKQEGVVGAAGKGVLAFADKGGKVVGAVETVANPTKLVGKAFDVFGGGTKAAGETAEAAEPAVPAAETASEEASGVEAKLQGHLEHVEATLKGGKANVFTRATLKVQKETLEDVLKLKRTGVKGLVGEVKQLGGHAAKFRFSELMDAYDDSGLKAAVSRGSEAAKLITNPLESLAHPVLGELDHASAWLLKQTANVVNGDDYTKKLAKYAAEV